MIIYRPFKDPVDTGGRGGMRPVKIMKEEARECFWEIAEGSCQRQMEERMSALKIIWVPYTDEGAVPIPHSSYPHFLEMRTSATYMFLSLHWLLEPDLCFLS